MRKYAGENHTNFMNVESSSQNKANFNKHTRIHNDENLSNAKCVIKIFVELKL